MNSSSSILDPLPTSILKKCLPVIIPHIKAIVNTSFVSGIDPLALKVAAVKPVLKKMWE